jgi:CheY-like chemotaxis protein
MRILLVEDDRDFVDGIKPRLEAVGNVVVTVAESRDAAFAVLDNLANVLLDIIVLDLKLPTANGSFDASVDHGQAVFSRAVQNAPGVPIILLTGSSVEQFTRKLVRTARQEDVWGEGQTVPTVDVFAKTDLPEFLDHMRALYPVVEATNNVDVTTGVQTLALSTVEKRTLRIFTRKRAGTTCIVSSLNGGLSASRVLRVKVHDGAGALQMDAAAKLGFLEVVDDESNRFANLDRLVPGSHPAKVEVIRFGAVNSGGVFYNLLNGYNSSLFDRLQQGDVDATLVPAIKEILSPWRQGVPTANVTIAQIRRKLLSDADLAVVQNKYGLIWIPEIEAKTIQSRSCCIHGDLHGGNLLLSNSGQPMLIDFGDVGSGTVSLDPITLELCLYFHPQFSPVSAAWLDGLDADNWNLLDQYAASMPRPQFVKDCRAWAHEVAASGREVLASAYAYLVRQLKYPDTDKQLAQRLLEAIRKAIYSTYD